MTTDGQFINPAFIFEKAEVFKHFSDGLKKHCRLVLPSGKSLEFYVGWLAMSSTLADTYIRMGVPPQMLTPFAQYNARLCYILAQLPYPEVEEFCKRFQEYVRDENTTGKISRTTVGLPPNARSLPNEMSDVEETVELEEVDWDAVFKIEEAEEEGRLQESSDEED